MLLEYQGAYALESDTVELHNDDIAIGEDSVYLSGGDSEGLYALYDDRVDTVEELDVLKKEVIQLTTGKHKDGYTIYENAWVLLDGNEKGGIIHDYDLDDYKEYKKVRMDNQKFIAWTREREIARAKEN